MKVSIRKYAEALTHSLKEEKGQSSEQKIQDLLGLLRRRKRSRYVKRFYGVFKKIWQDSNNQVSARIVLPYQPDEKELRALEVSLGEVMGKTVMLDVVVNEEVLGGMRLEFGDYIIDGTVLKNLELMGNKLKNS